MKTIWFVVIIGVLYGCSSQHDNYIKSMPDDRPKTQKVSQKYYIQPRDQLEIKFFYNPELNESVIVRPDGNISLQLLDDIKAEGLEPSQLDDFLTEKYSKELQNPVITVIVRSFEGLRVYVGGEVNNEGVIDLINTMTPLQAVINAGGFKETADMEKAIVITKGSENNPVPIAINLKDALHGKGDSAAYILKHNDIVFVPKTAIAKLNKFVNQYVENLLLYKGISLGFTYELRNQN
ncbi:MAG: sugar transporter [Desulfobacterales bacterium]|nr:sugar transporter [Desulfobacterales bacterium]